MHDLSWQENKVITHIKKRTTKQRFHQQRIGLGDDALAFDTRGRTTQLVTMDSMVENIHWKSAWCSPAEVAEKLVAVNVSDMAAMGGIPQRAFLTASIPRYVRQQVVNQFLDRLVKALSHYAIDLAGGDTTASPGAWMLTLTLQGQSRGQRILTRDQAKPGDMILLTGHAGAAAAGRFLLDKPIVKQQPWRQTLINRFLYPEPRLEASRLLLSSRRVQTAMDSSDGLARDLRQLAASSRVGAVLYATNVPLSVATRMAARYYHRDPLEWALTGGEDYELLFTCAPKDVGPVMDLMQQGTQLSCTIIGEIKERQAGLKLLTATGQRNPLPQGFEHGR